MKKNIHFYYKDEFIKDSVILDKIGLRGREANDFARLNLPVVPGFVIDSDIASDLESKQFISDLKPYIAKIGEKLDKTFDSEDKKPLTLKIFVSPNLVITTKYFPMHNFGITRKTLKGFVRIVGENFAYNEALFMLNGTLQIESKIAELEKDDSKLKKLSPLIDVVVKKLNEKVTEKDVNDIWKSAEEFLPAEFFEDAYAQLEYAIRRLSKLLSLDEMNDNDTAIGISGMVYGNSGEKSFSGSFDTRNPVTGDKKLHGEYYQNTFDFSGIGGKDINKIEKGILGKLTKISSTVEDYFKNIRIIRFTIDCGKLWLVDQREEMNISTQASIKILLDLNQRKIVDEKYVLSMIKPEQLNEILHPTIDKGTVSSMKKISGGIAGAPGAAIGRVFFSTEKLLDAYKNAKQKGMDTKVILCMPSTFAEDVKAIEVAEGVLTAEGGYAAHASVVARQYGKVSLIFGGISFKSRKAVINGQTVEEGDYLTINVPNYGLPEIYFGKAGLIEQDYKSSGILDIIKFCRKACKNFTVRVNADKPRDVSLAKTFGADGIGLCRTEHMFFDAKRINVFRQMIIAKDTDTRKKALEKIKTMQKTDFYKLFKIMGNLTVTIRLMDAPLHEFLPHNDAEFTEFMDYLKNQKGFEKMTRAEVAAFCDSINEFNPMLGHRGCRIAVSYPEIYEMQMRAIFEAVYELQKEGIKVNPEIMIPIIMNSEELKLIIYGKKIEGGYIKGLLDVEEEIRKNMKAKPVKFKVGTMVELPAAALSAGEIAQYAEFFSFGTNDLTQTTLGLSRDDFNNFMPDYTQFDIIKGNPFALLDNNVKELISIAVRRGKMTRPGLVLGLCGEQGAVPENIKFCIEIGLDYVSCSTYSVPIAELAAARYFINNQQ